MFVNLFAQETFIEDMNNLGAAQLNVTLVALAAGLPLYNVFVVARALNMNEALAGIISAVSVSWVFAGILSIVAYK